MSQFLIANKIVAQKYYLQIDKYHKLINVCPIYQLGK